jgi:hypothetical protein
MSYTLLVIGGVCLIVGLNLAIAAWFHISSRNRKIKKEPEPVVAKLIDKKTAWTDHRPSYDYQRTSMMGSPRHPDRAWRFRSARTLRVTRRPDSRAGVGAFTIDKK